MRDWLLVCTVFLASAVEAVEALTIVLAVGVSRGWRSALQGVAAGLATLGLIVAMLGPALAQVPIDVLRLFVGGLLLIFGLGWLKKSILRASGFKSVHDEAAIYASELEAARAAQRSGTALVGDWYAFTLCFKGVLLEGLEVAFIVVTFGSNQDSIPLATFGAVAAVLVVTAAGVAVRGPLARVPENAMKFAVGVLLTAFGIFWAAEGAGVEWPGHDTALLGVLGVVAAAALALTAGLRRIRVPHEPLPPGPEHPARARRP